MFNGAQGWSDRATVFADGKLLGNPHWIEWRTKADVTVKSAAVFAKQNVTGSRRAFSKFTLFAKEQNNWVEEAQYSPSLPYGGNCAADACKTSFEPGTVLAVCVNVSRPIAAQE